MASESPSQGGAHDAPARVGIVSGEIGKILGRVAAVSGTEGREETADLAVTGRIAFLTAEERPAV
jgi:hypothetical protein